MKNRTLNIGILILFISMSISGFGQTKSSEQGQLVGNDKDDHGCIATAGYQWSKIKRECIRPFEIGLSLKNSQDSNGSTVCYILIDDELELIEAYLPELNEGILLHKLFDYWSSADANYSITMTDSESIQLIGLEDKLLYHRGDLPNRYNPDLGYDDIEDEGIHEFGLIKAIEDGPYPMFVVTVEFPERQMTHSFNLNIEAIAMDMNELYEMEGKYATIYYTSTVEDFLMDVHYNGKTILGEDAPEIDPEWHAFTGILSGAGSVTNSDLPSVISVTNAEGETHYFEEYIYEDMVAVNGKKVTVYYYLRTFEDIIQLSPSNY